MSNWRPFILPTADPIRITRDHEGRTDVIVDVTAYLTQKPAAVKPNQHVVFSRLPGGMICVSRIPAKLAMHGDMTNYERDQLLVELARTFALAEDPGRAALVTRAFDRIISAMAGHRDYLFYHMRPLLNDLVTRLVPIVGAWIPPQLKGSVVAYQIVSGQGPGQFNKWVKTDEGQEILSSFDPATNIIEFSL